MPKLPDTTSRVQEQTPEPINRKIQHAIQGWCPPLSVIRRMSVRTMKEIDQEKEALQELL
ncbi:hypothetical protein [Planococcus chinensis]|uniref:Uncharacterized protein n=1 Tax=Planococcus chinensis TaxID=272917 RepID=A0ABW4QHB3_9BACL